MQIKDARSLVKGIDLDTRMGWEMCPHPSGAIPILVLPRDGVCEINVLVRLAAGREFKEEAHPYDEQISILRGTGDFLLDGKPHAYNPGDTFIVASGTPHAFAFVDSTTVYVVHVPDVRPKRK